MCMRGDRMRDSVSWSRCLSFEKWSYRRPESDIVWRVMNKGKERVQISDGHVDNGLLNTSSGSKHETIATTADMGCWTNEALAGDRREEGVVIARDFINVPLKGLLMEGGFQLLPALCLFPPFVRAV